MDSPENSRPLSVSCGWRTLHHFSRMLKFRLSFAKIHLADKLWFGKVMILKKAILYIHGKGGSHLEAEQYKNICRDYDVWGFDYTVDVPWVVEEKLQAFYNEISEKYTGISIIANSIGAYFTMNSLKNRKIEKAFFISPIVNMEKLILDMMTWANVTEQELQDKEEIETSFGETLSWKYLSYVREHPIRWKAPTEILYAGRDHLTSRKTIDEFVFAHNAGLTIMEDGEHWFHTEKQLAFLEHWLLRVV